MKNNERGFCVFFDWLESLEYLPREVVGEIIFAIRDYYAEGGDPTERFEGATRAIVKMMLAQIKRAERRSQMAEKSGEKEAKTETKTEPKTEPKTETEAEAETETEKNKETKLNIAPEGARVTVGEPPTLGKSREFSEPSEAEVKSYARSLRIPESEAEDFYDYYRARGWYMGAEKMHEWHSALKMWHKRGRGSAVDMPRHGDFDVNAAFERALARSMGAS